MIAAVGLRMTTPADRPAKLGDVRPDPGGMFRNPPPAIMKG
jgi:hypothetical protein